MLILVLTRDPSRWRCSPILFDIRHSLVPQDQRFQGLSVAVLSAANEFGFLVGIIRDFGEGIVHDGRVSVVGIVFRFDDRQSLDTRDARV